MSFRVSVDPDGRATVSLVVEDEAAQPVPPLVQAREPDPALQDALAAACVRGRLCAAEILASPDMVSADGLAQLLGTSRVTVNAKRKLGQHLELDAAKRGFRFPVWQLDADGRPYPELAALQERLEEPWASYRFLVEPQGAPGGLTGRQAAGEGPRPRRVGGGRRRGVWRPHLSSGGVRPSPGFATAPLTFYAVAGGERFGRIAPALPGPLDFGKTPSRFSDPRLRVEASRSGVLYLGQTFRVCFLEAVLRDRRDGLAGELILAKQDLAGLIVATSRWPRPCRSWTCGMTGHSRVACPRMPPRPAARAWPGLVGGVPRPPGAARRHHLPVPVQRAHQPRALRPGRAKGQGRPPSPASAGVGARASAGGPASGAG